MDRRCKGSSGRKCARRVPTDRSQRRRHRTNVVPTRCVQRRTGGHGVALFNRVDTELKPGGWITEHPGDVMETVESYTHIFGGKRKSRKMPNSDKKTLVLVWIDQEEPNPRQGSILDTLLAIIPVYYPGIEVLQASGALEPPPQGKQHVFPAVQDQLRRHNQNRSVFATMGITGYDLTSPGLEFEFGHADQTSMIGVMSLYHFEMPELYPVVSVFLHEIGHLFQLSHCTEYHCIMNGSNDMDELCSHPLTMCSLCEQKLQVALGQVQVQGETVDHTARYEQVQHILRQGSDNS